MKKSKSSLLILEDGNFLYWLYAIFNKLKFFTPRYHDLENAKKFISQNKKIPTPYFWDVVVVSEKFIEKMPANVGKNIVVVADDISQVAPFWPASYICQKNRDEDFWKNFIYFLVEASLEEKEGIFSRLIKLNLLVAPTTPMG